MLSGYLMSKATLVGRVGMSLFYQEYNFLKSWWQGALLVFFILLLLFLALRYIQKKVVYGTAKTISTCFILAGLLGLYFTFFDFRHSLSHKLLGERFHLGVYLFWLGWLVVAVYYFLQQKDHQSIHVHSVE